MLATVYKRGRKRKFPAEPTSKVCTKCGIERQTNEFGVRADYPDRKKSWCKHCENQYRTNRYQTDVGYRQAIGNNQKAYNYRLKVSVIQYYGGHCACCGETELKFLTIDHINGGGQAHRNEIGEGSATLYKFLRKNNYPEGYQVLCFNCNCAKGFFGECPHTAPSMKRPQQLVLFLETAEDNQLLLF